MLFSAHPNIHYRTLKTSGSFNRVQRLDFLLQTDKKSAYNKNYKHWICESFPGPTGFEPVECRSQSPVPYRLAMAQEMIRCHMNAAESLIQP